MYFLWIVKIDNIIYNIDIKLNLKIVDQNAPYSETSYSKDEPIQPELAKVISNEIKNNIQKLFLIEKESNCDFLKIKEKLYRFHTKEYEKYKDNYLDKIILKINIDIK